MRSASIDLVVDSNQGKSMSLLPFMPLHLGSNIGNKMNAEHASIVMNSVWACSRSRCGTAETVESSVYVEITRNYFGLTVKIHVHSGTFMWVSKSHGSQAHLGHPGSKGSSMIHNFSRIPYARRTWKLAHLCEGQGVSARHNGAKAM